MSKTEADNLKQVAQVASRYLKAGEGWVMLSQPGICWKCSGYYYYLGKEIEKCDSTELLLITYRMRKATKEEMYDGLTWNFNEQIHHLENAEAFQELNGLLKPGYRLIHVSNGAAEIYPIDNRDSMNRIWPSLKAKIQECSPSP
ncbi:MAG: hypothetical protein LPK49_12485 [Bacteroidota bacterium]|nr:hypothetical protein [Bacteroidota bacterium]